MINNRLRIAFAGTPQFAATHLEALISSEHHLVGVFSQPDRRGQRGNKLQQSPVKKLALANNIPTHQPHSMNEPEAAKTLLTLNPDVLIVVAYGLIVPQQILSIPNFGCLNVHGSILPRWRGAAPIQRAIESGDKETGITIIQMDEGLDTGSSLAMKHLPIQEHMTSEELSQLLSHAGSDLLLEVLSKLDEFQNSATPQSSLPGEPCYAKKLVKEEAQIDWSFDAKRLAQKINAFNPSPVCYSHLGEKRIKIWQAQSITKNRVETIPGTILSADKNSITVACGTGQIQLKKLQLPGGKILSPAALLSGHKILFSIGSRFSEITES